MVTKFQQELIDAALNWRDNSTIILNARLIGAQNIEELKSNFRKTEAQFMELVKRAVDISNLDLTCRSMIRDPEGKHRA